MAAEMNDRISTRGRILDAALTAFAARGVEATSLDSLAVTIGIRKQTILYWFPSKEQLLLGVVHHAVEDIGARLSEAVANARPRRVGAGSPVAPVLVGGGAPGPAVDLSDRLVAVVDAVFRFGTSNPELLAVVREVTRLGPPATTHLAAAVEPLVVATAVALPGVVDHERVRIGLLSAGARVVGLATEAQVRADLGLAPDLAWLRAHRTALIESLTESLS